MAIYQNDKIIFEEYDDRLCQGLISCLLRPLPLLLNRLFDGSAFSILLGEEAGGGPEALYEMWSATKSLSGVAAALLAKQGRMMLDDVVAQYVSQWSGDADKSSITIRQLLSLSSGIETWNIPRTEANLEEILNAPYLEPQFAYGSQPFIIFSYIVQQITGVDSETFLKQEFLQPLGVDSLVIEPIEDGTGTPDLASGGKAVLPDLIKVGGELMEAARGQGQILNATDVESFTLPGLNPSYGLSFWLNTDDGFSPTGDALEATFYPACDTSEVFSMLGMGGQIVTVVPPKRLVVVVSSRVGLPEDQNEPGLFDALFENVPCRCIV